MDTSIKTDKNGVPHGYTRILKYTKDSDYVKRWEKDGRKDEAFEIIAACISDCYSYGEVKKVLQDYGLLYMSDTFHSETYNAILINYSNDIFKFIVNFNLTLTMICSRLAKGALDVKNKEELSNYLLSYLKYNQEAVGYKLAASIGSLIKKEKGNDTGKLSEETINTLNNISSALCNIKDPVEVVDEDEQT